VEMWSDWITLHPEALDLALFLGYVDGTTVREQRGISGEEFQKILPPDIDGLCLLEWNTQSAWNHEAEIALLQRGCDRLIPAISQIVLKGKWLDPEVGRRELDRIPWEVESEHKVWQTAKAEGEMSAAVAEDEQREFQLA